MDRDKIAALGLNVNQVETALYNAYGTRQVSQIYAPNNQYQVILQVAPEFQTRSGGAAAALRAIEHGSARSARHGRASQDRRRRAGGQPLRPAAVGDDLLQPQAGRRARRCRRRDPADGRRDAAVDDRDEVPGRGAGVPGFAAGPRPDPRDGDRRHLHRAGHPVRELHAPADDSLRPAVGRLRRAAHAADLQDRAEPLRVRRHHHARRSREEERHHDGGLRRRGAARSTARRRSRRSTKRASSASVRS